MAVEAQSLSHITNIASNPPLYPRNPTETELEPLTLYIVRVPGSRDIFLTPLKPREKVVNAQDVTSCLYFLHIDSPEDTQLSDTEPTEQQLRASPILSGKRLSSASTISRKPLPTPPESPDDGVFSFPIIPPRSSNKYLSVPTRKPLVSSRSSLRNSSYGSTSTTGEHQQIQPSEVAKSCGTSLTLIRRDPTTGAQWNVAKIRDPPMEDISSDALSSQESFNSQSKAAGAPLYIDIDNPGYSKFLRSETNGSSPRGSVVSDSSEGAFSASTSRTTFSRRLWMDGSRFGDHTYSQTRPSLHLPSGGNAFVDRRAKGYAFISPWGGKCEFSTGTAGRSLKCRHRVESTASHTESTTDISELRFNLPTKNPSSSVDLGASTKRSSYYGHQRSKSEPSNDVEPHWTSLRDDKGAIDYSLGRERAGGGFGGKQAKLGKLIINQEGQKFMDLVVAANLGLWWRAYERTS